MDTNTHNIYLFKALDAYPYQLEETVEALNYALSYDDTNVTALCLMANVHAYQLRDYETAKYYYEAAVASKMEMPDIYPDYIFALISNEDFEEAQKLLDFAKTIKATDKAWLDVLQGRLYEITGCTKDAVKAFKEALGKAIHPVYINFIKNEMERAKNKLPKKKKRKKKRKKNKKKKRKEKKKNRSKK